MISEFIRSKVEERFGKSVHCSFDCEELMMHILATTGFRISESAIAGLFGVNSEIREPKLYALGVIAIYLDYDSSMQLRDDYNHVKFNLLTMSRVDGSVAYTCTCVSV
jgi:hypothetical protein